MTAALVFATGTSDAARAGRGGYARAGGYAYRGAVRGGVVAGPRVYAHGQSPTYRSWSSGHYYGGGYPVGGWHYHPYYPAYGYYPHAYVSLGFGAPWYAPYPVYYPVYYPGPDGTVPNTTAPQTDGQTPDQGAPGASVAPEPALVDSTTSFDVTNDPPPGTYYYDRFCKRKFKNLDDCTDHLQGQSHPATIEIMEKDGTGMLSLEFVGGVWRVRH
jgi:hypothetical protein